MGRAVSHRSRNHSCGAYARRTRAQGSVDRGYRNLPTYGEGIMQTRIEVGILGATGMVGQHFIKFLQGHPWFDLTWLGASDRSAGKKYADAMTWHLGVVPETVGDIRVDACKPGSAPRLFFFAMGESA